MERGPLPPHERTWRHPSELAALESARLRADPGGRSLRTAALVSGSLGLVLIGALAVMVTPRQENNPLAVQTSPSFVDPNALVPVTTALFGMAVGELTSAFGVPRAAAAPDEHMTPQATTTMVATATIPTGTDAVVLAALATPLQSGMALVTARSIDGRAAGDRIAVRLASGATADATIVATFGHAAFVSIASVPAGEPAHDVATSLPTDDDMVTVLLSPPREVRLAELAAVGAPEGTAVVDADGRLVGLCTRADDGSMGLAMVDPEAGVGAPTSPPATSAPVTEAVPAAVATTAPSTPSTTAPSSAPPSSAPVASTAPASAPVSAPPSASPHD